jgi:steroid delta-isomerase-like uncharacterized protein
MSAADLNRRWIDAVNRHDAAAVAELYAPNAIVHDPAYNEPLEGRDAIARDLEAFFEAVPDLTFEYGELLERGPVAAAEGRFHGTHRGVLVTAAGNLPPTGKTIDVHGASFWRVDGQERILEERRYYDMAGLFAQLEVTV